jgi:inorganic pyrophosphatase
VYKALEPGKEVHTAAWVDQAAAWAEIESCRERLALAEGDHGG